MASAPIKPWNWPFITTSADSQSRKLPTISLEEAEKLLLAQLQQPRVAGDTSLSLDFPRALREWANQYGITPEEAQREVENWIAEVRQRSTDLRERARAEFLAGRFNEAAMISDQAAGEKLARSKHLGAERHKLIIEAVADLCLSGEALISGGNPGEALARYEQALGYVSRNEDPLAWARLQISVGRSYLGIGLNSSNDALRSFQLAATNLQGALSALPRKRFPEHRALAEGLLSATYFSHGMNIQNDRIAAVQLFGDAVAASRESAELYSELQPLGERWRNAKRVFVLALFSQAQQSDGETALRLYEEVSVKCRETLQAFPIGQYPKDWAVMQGDILGRALFYQAQRATKPNAARLFAETVIAYRESLKGYSRDLSPESWAFTKHMIGKSLSQQAERTSNAADERILLHEALGAYREAVATRYKDSAMAKSELIGVLMSLANDDEIETPQLLREAEQSGRELLSAVAREENPLSWANARANLAMVLIKRSRSDPKKEASPQLSEALTMCRETLEVFSRDKFPEQWMTIQNCLGAVLTAQAERREGAEAQQLFSEARAAFIEALLVTEFPYQHDATKRNLSEVERALSGLNPSSK